MEYDSVIVGGGPVAAHVASKLAGAGFSTLVVEEHSRVGKPVQCAGLVTTKLQKLINIESCIVNSVNGAHIFSPRLHELVLYSSEPKAYVIDRAKFDQLLMNKAEAAGAQLMLGTKVVDANRIDTKNNRSKMEIMTKTRKGSQRIRTGLLIGADGANSKIRNRFGFEQPWLMLKGIGREFKFSSIPQDFVQIFSGNEIAPGFFAWVIPAGETVRIGLCVADGNGKLVDYFNNFQKFCKKSGLIPDVKPVQSITGSIPLGILDSTTADNIMLVGDAAAQVKPTSGGGIYPGLKCADICAEIAISALEAGDLSNQFLERYHRMWSKLIGTELEKGLRLHRAFLNLTDEKIEEAFDILDKSDILKVISRKGDIESPFALAKLLFKKAPRLIKFAGPYFRSLSKK